MGHSHLQPPTVHLEPPAELDAPPAEAGPVTPPSRRRITRGACGSLTTSCFSALATQPDPSSPKATKSARAASEPTARRLWRTPSNQHARETDSGCVSGVKPLCAPLRV